ncbi:MAG: cysteine methyltransferase [Dehalococcoidia bacterium]|nr:cysteine methyltransferase [Dehalococcoidia bacterium]|tara:strand:- start:78 stop:389 length:312 start_codon:yes stop_codon:yes gene_type:complete
MPAKPFDTFKRIFTLVSAIPYGRVSTYGQIADMASIYSARIVGFALASLKESHGDIPWHRVVNINGEISPRSLDQMLIQKELLVSEGIKFSKKGRIDFSIYGW